MLRVHGDRRSLLAALIAHWSEQQLQLPAGSRPRPQNVKRVLPRRRQG